MSTRDKNCRRADALNELFSRPDLSRPSRSARRGVGANCITVNDAPADVLLPVLRYPAHRSNMK
jgi:hypothetical protein